WYDALCINQGDKDEKGHQVRLMSRIFSSAASVLAYIGEESENSSLAFNTMLKIGTDFLQEYPGHGLLRIKPATRWQEEGFPAYGSEGLKAVLAVCERPWFRRIWIVQELLLASK
ncbi:heterokaryon incompatibility, partial [Lepidopterella palustris CBS 459.81]